MPLVVPSAIEFPVCRRWHVSVELGDDGVTDEAVTHDGRVDVS